MIKSHLIFFRASLLVLMSLSYSNYSFAQKEDKVKELSPIELKAQSIGEVPTIKSGDKKVKAPLSPEGYSVELKGTARPQVVDINGNITTPLVDSEVQLYYQLVDNKTGERTDIENKIVTITGTDSPSRDANSAPNVIPSLREWSGATGNYTLKKSGTILVSPESYITLKESMENFSTELNFFREGEYEVKAGESKSNAIFVTLNCNDESLGEEGYILTISDRITIEANTAQGLFMGTRTVLQLANIYGDAIPRGVARDYPKYARRGFMLDVGRKFFRIEYLRDYIKILSYYKMNEFHVHLSDNGFKQFYDNDWSKTYAAFRLETDRYPGLTAKDGSYSKEEFRDLQKMGMEYGVNVIPEIDIPAHTLAFTQYRPSLGSEKYGMDHLDITKEETYTFFDNLFDEYLTGDNPVFIGPDVHIGTDEYSKEEAEAFRKFTNHYLELVQSYGKRARLWGALTHAEGTTPVTSENVIMNAWYNGYADPSDMIDQGYELISTSDRHLYIVPATGYYFDYLDLKFLYKDWEPNLIGGDIFPFGHPQISGGTFAVWNDHSGNGISEKDVHHRTFPALQVLAEKMWEGKKANTSLEQFQEVAEKMIESPYVNIMGNIESEGNTVAQYNFEKSSKRDLSPNQYNIENIDGVEWKKGDGLKLDGEGAITTPLEEIGYPYNVNLSITFNSDISAEATLFSSANAEVVVTPKDNKVELGFKRDGYFYTFKHLLNRGRRYSISVEGDNKGTSLFVNGKRVERLEGKVIECIKENGKESNMYIQQTLLFPLRSVGNSSGASIGTIHNLQINKR